MTLVCITTRSSWFITNNTNIHYIQHYIQLSIQTTVHCLKLKSPHYRSKTKHSKSINNSPVPVVTIIKSIKPEQINFLKVAMTCSSVYQLRNTCARMKSFIVKTNDSFHQLFNECPSNGKTENVTRVASSGRAIANVNRPLSCDSVRYEL